MFRLLIVVLIVSAASGRKFQNPVLDGGDYPDPGVILYQGLYYAVTTSLSGEDKFPIHVSADLQNWNFTGRYGLTQENTPQWSVGRFYTPEIHQIGENDFRLFYSTQDRESGKVVTGVGISENILGPYVIQNQPIHDPSKTSYEGTLVQDGGRKILIWKDSETIYGRELSPDCLGFAQGSETKLLMSPSLDWEGTKLGAPWLVHRADGWYMFYSGNGYCGDRYAVGVARSQNPLEPFEKHGDPILVSDDAFKGPGHCSVVADINFASTVMVYHAFKANEVCGSFPRALMSQSVEWRTDGWPYMVPN